MHLIAGTFFFFYLKKVFVTIIIIKKEEIDNEKDVNVPTHFTVNALFLKFC